MKNRLSILLLALVAVVATNAQSIANGSRWTNGQALYTAEVRLGGYVYLAGEGRDAGEMTLESIEDEPNSYRLTLSHQAEDWESIDQTAVLKYVNREGIETIEYWQYYPNGKVILCDVLERTYKSLEQVMTDDWIFLYQGTYKNQDGKQWTFDKNTLKRDGDVKTFEVQKEFGRPTNVIAVDGQYLQMVPSLEGWNAYACRLDDDGEMFQRSGEPIVLRWADSTRGRFYFGSERILNNRLIHCFNKDGLRLMRNEIMARQHYPFTSAALKDYFGSQPWYEPQADAKDFKLSYIEELNVKLIQNCESIDDREYYYLMED